MATHTIYITQKLSIAQLETFLNDEHAKVELSEEATQAIIKGRNYLEEKLKTHNAPIYGVNTGFGSLCNVVIPANDLEKLQENLIKSHACGMGNTVSSEIVKLMLFLKVQSLSYGKSGIQLSTVERLIDLLNNNVYPVVYEQGSLGASGDLAPLAHLCLPLIGIGNVNYKGEIKNAADVLKTLGLKPITLGSKEGLALLNGTQFMSAYGVYCLMKANKLNKAADTISAISLEGFDGRIDPFKASLHKIRAHKGQIETADAIQNILKGSQIIAKQKTQVQDPYSFRCIPQVHGATKDVTKYAHNIFEIEINSVTDNPTIFPEDDEILSGGNFHGQPLALALDFLCIAMSELASISERRIYLLISGQRGLPPFLTKEAGLNSGFMITQYTAASIVSQSKQLCTPASADSIVSSNGQEDHVSMGANAATKCLTVIYNTEKVISIELLNAIQALEFKQPLKSSATIEAIFTSFRKRVPFVSKDVYMYELIQNSLEFLQHHAF
ncbi:MAG: histidine ammonia-lyase [Bacteroidota bacterium]|nr:histidine ammonia-lyase [Bacteroidota bacterium]